MKNSYKIAAHPIQQAILDLVSESEIAFGEMSLRSIGEKIGVKNKPQQIKHHLTQMVRYGFLDVVGGKYKIGSSLTPKP